ncbi:hypothetical protein D3C80_1486010 [compost metagenome]
MLRLVDRIVDAIEDKVQEIRHYRFAALRFDHLNDPVVGVRVELDQNFADNTDLRLQDRVDRQTAELGDNPADHPFVLTEREVRQAALAALHAFAVQQFCASRNPLVRSEPVQ